MPDDGADGETRTPTAFATAPSRQRVYQFHHVGWRCLIVETCCVLTDAESGITSVRPTARRSIPTAPSPSGMEWAARRAKIPLPVPGRPSVLPAPSAPSPLF